MVLIRMRIKIYLKQLIKEESNKRQSMAMILNDVIGTVVF